jgi:hypothetical protein
VASVISVESVSYIVNYVQKIRSLYSGESFYIYFFPLFISETILKDDWGACFSYMLLTWRLLKRSRMETVPLIPRIIELFDSTCIKQFESLGCDMERVSQADGSNDLLAADIEAVSNDLRLKLHLSVPKSLLLQLLPAGSGVQLQDQSLLDDWILELSNRFLGRLKNKLVSHDCSLQMGLPSAYVVSEVAPVLRDGEEQVLRFFEINKQTMACCLSIEVLKPDLSLSEYEDEDEDWFEESELVHL